MYKNYPVNYPTNYQMMDYRGMNDGYGYGYGQDDERFFWAPFVVGGLAGTALGFGIANNNQINNGTMQPVYPMYPYPVYQSYPVYPTYSNSNNYYY